MGKPIEELGLGRWHAPDERDERYLMQSRLEVEPEELPSLYLYFIYHSGDQGSTPQCVGYTMRHYLSSTPLRRWDEKPTATDLYHLAQLNDEWPGQDYAGSSVRGGVKALKSLGLVDSYWWAWDAETIKRWLLEAKGTVMVGTNWYYDMYFPNEDGLVTPSGSKMGGHAYLCNGYVEHNGLFRFQNSWGREWGEYGTFYMSGEDFERLINEQGEACVALKEGENS